MSKVTGIDSILVSVELLTFKSQRNMYKKSKNRMYACSYVSFILMKYEQNLIIMWNVNCCYINCRSKH